MSNKTFRIFTDQMGGRSAAAYVGSPGELFYDPEVGALRVSDGTTAGGKPAELAEASTQIPVTNQYFVDPARTDTYTASGTIITPFKTIAAAQAAIEAAITAGTITPGESSPVFIILCGNTTENITMTRGHVFLVGLNGGIHAPIYITGQITINGADSSTGALDNNHFSIYGLTIVGPSQGAAIYFTGSNAQRLMLKDVWLTARGSKTGSTPMVDAGGYGINADNTGVRAADSKRSVVHGSDIKVSHTGTGDVYCFRIAAGTADFTSVETSGATQVGMCASNTSLSFTSSTLDANGDTVVEAYGNGIITCTLSSITNIAANSNGVRINTTGGTAVIGNCLFGIPTGTGKAVYGVTGGTLIHSGNIFNYGSNVNRSPALTVLALPNAFVSA